MVLKQHRLPDQNKRWAPPTIRANKQSQLSAGKPIRANFCQFYRGLQRLGWTPTTCTLRKARDNSFAYFSRQALKCIFFNIFIYFSATLVLLGMVKKISLSYEWKQ